MRKVLGLGAAATALMAGGCRQSEEDVLAELRRQMMQQCSAGSSAARAANPNFDAERFCGCVTDKAFAGRSVAEIQQLFDDPEKKRAAARAAGLACRPSDSQDLPPIELAEPAPAGENKQHAQAERPQRNQAAARPKAPPPRPRDPGPIATPTTGPVPPPAPPPATPPRPPSPPPPPAPPPPAPVPPPTPPAGR
jgi:hypothetical protein